MGVREIVGGEIECEGKRERREREGDQVGGRGGEGDVGGDIESFIGGSLCSVLVREQD